MDIIEVSKWFGAIAVILGAMGLIWKTVLKPLKNTIKQAAKVGEALPILLSIAEQFKNNGGNTLRDRIDSISGMVEAARLSAETAKTVAETNATIVKETSNIHNEELARLRERVDERHVENVEAINELKIVAAGMGEKINGIDDRLDALTPFIVRNRVTDE